MSKADKKEQSYIRKRLWKARMQSICFYICRIFPIQKNKVVFCCIEGTTGYSCNPKYIAKELIRRDANVQIVWLVDNMTKEFPATIKKVKNTLWNRAYQLSTAKVWIDNSRKQLEVRKRKKQFYIQTWHAKLGFKPTCLDRGASFSKIAYLVSKHDSDLVDYWLSNGDWYNRTLPTGSLYEGETLCSGSPRCDILVKSKNDVEFKNQTKKKLIEYYNLNNEGVSLEDIHFLMYAPTFRGGSQGTNREILAGQGFPDFQVLLDSIEARFGGTWYLLLRLHPQLVARNLDQGVMEAYDTLKGKVLSASRVEDMYEILAGCDAFVTDYSSAAFDAAVMEIPIFLYADDYESYEGERGKLLWNLRELPFPLATDKEELQDVIQHFDDSQYIRKLYELVKETGMVEDGHASAHVADKIQEWCR